MSEDSARHESATAQDVGDRDLDLSSLGHMIVEDTGDLVIHQEANRVGAEDELRLTESEAEALLDYDRVVTQTRRGRKVVIEVLPDDPNHAPIEVRNSE